MYNMDDDDNYTGGRPYYYTKQLYKTIMPKLLESDGYVLFYETVEPYSVIDLWGVLHLSSCILHNLMGKRKR